MAKVLAQYAAAIGWDGYQAVVVLAEIDPSFRSGEIPVADKRNAKPLDEYSGLTGLVVTEDNAGPWAVRNLATMVSRLEAMRC